MDDDDKKLKAAEEAKQLTERDLNDLRVVVSTAEGRRWFWRQMGQNGTFRKSFAANDAITNFNEGRRAAGNNMFHDLMAAKPEAFLQMQREAAALVKSDERKIQEDSKS